MPVNYASLPFKQQIAYLKNKTNLPSQRWADIWVNAHNRAFTIAGAMQDDLLADFRSAVDKAISEGKSLGWFKQQFDHITAHHGWQYKGNRDWRANVIYETNIRQSYTAGREQQIDALKGTRPYGIYKHSGSENPRHDHLKWHNLVLPLDDPWWQTHSPINGYGCACKKFTLSEADLKRMGLKVGKAPAIETYEWIDKATGELHHIPKGIDPGFDYTPKNSAELTKIAKAAVAKKPPLATRLSPRSVEHTFSTVNKVNAIEISRILDELQGTPSHTALKQFLNHHDTKTLILKAGELSGTAKARAIAQQVEEYLQTGRANISHFYTRRPRRVNGFTSPRWNHVVVKAKSTDTLKNLFVSDITTQITHVFEKAKTGKPVWSFSTAARRHTEGARVFTTWLHEIGHQVYFKANTPLVPQPLLSNYLTEYAASNPHEWFAEHFVAWVLTPERLKQAAPNTFTFISETVSKTS
ncbi:phage minor head protein [Thaumasiovibrio subtropicus]|uniref:phage minor head protein n=1 Tax=Thaumasiovibrio subtropicus TaxID=1891207 RepID=UPI000B36208F|nr:phage minor head protein [Thaumasiovibrio subtropicus]